MPTGEGRQESAEGLLVEPAGASDAASLGERPPERRLGFGLDIGRPARAQDHPDEPADPEPKVLVRLRPVDITAVLVTPGAEASAGAVAGWA
jgi:hypothetical protein